LLPGNAWHGTPHHRGGECRTHDEDPDQAKLKLDRN